MIRYLQRTRYYALSVEETPQITPSPSDFVTLLEDDRATAMGNVHKNMVNISRGQTDRQTCLSQYFATALASAVASSIHLGVCYNTSDTQTRNPYDRSNRHHGP